MLPNILQCSTLNPFDWMVAYAALTLPHFCADHIPVLQNPQVRNTFDTKIRQPLLSGQLEVVAAYFIALLPPLPSTTSEQPWILNSKTRKPPASTLPPTDDHIIQAPASQMAKSPFHLDNIHAAVANLASSLQLMTFLNPQKDGLKSLFSPPTPVRVYLATSIPIPKRLLAMASSLSLRMEFTNLFPKTLLLRSLLLTTANKECVSTLGILLLVDPSLPSLLFVSPLPLSLILSVVPANPLAPLHWLLYLFCLTTHSPTLSIFVPHRPGRSSSVMVYDLDVNHPAPLLPPSISSPTPDPLSIVGGHPLRGNTDACIILGVHKMLTDNISFVVHSSDNCYGTDTVLLSPQYFTAAFTFTPFGAQQTWPTPGSPVTVTHSSRPKYVPPTHSIAEAVRSTAADARLQTTFSRPLPNQPADDDTEMTGPTIEGEITYSSEVETALDRLLSSIDHPPFSIDEEHYIALSQLPLTYPWPSITIDLRPYVPFLERHLVAHLLSGRCGPLPVDVPAHTILDAWLKLLSEAIVHGIFDPHHAAYTPPPLPGPLMSPRFWHAHLNHACTRAVSPLGGAGTTDNMAGDQLAIWNQVNVNSNEPIPSTHLTIFVPPSLGAFILANLKSPKGDPPQLRPVIPSQPHSSSVLTPSRPFHLDLPPIFPENEDLIMDNARQAAAAGFIRPESIPLLALTDESFYRPLLRPQTTPHT